MGGDRFSGPIQPISKAHTAFCTSLLDLFPGVKRPEHGPSHHLAAPGSSVRLIHLNPLCAYLGRNEAALTGYVGSAKYE